MMPEDGLDTLATCDEIYLGAVGWPTVPDNLSLWGLLLPIRRTFGQYVNLRPARLLRGVTSPLAEPNDLDITVVRENTEGEYSDSGGRVYKDTPYEIAVQESIFTRRGVERIIRYAFEEAKARRGLLVGATKSNGISITMPFFDEIFREISSDYPEVEASLMHADALAARLVLAPHSFDVVVGSNLFGDLLSEVTAAIAGAIGIAPSANLNPEGKYPSLFEPIHGSAPDIAGQGTANPSGAIWAGAMMLDHAGFPDAGARILAALEETLAQVPRPATSAVQPRQTRWPQQSCSVSELLLPDLGRPPPVSRAASARSHLQVPFSVPSSIRFSLRLHRRTRIKAFLTLGSVSIAATEITTSPPATATSIHSPVIRPAPIPTVKTLGAAVRKVTVTYWRKVSVGASPAARLTRLYGMGTTTLKNSSSRQPPRPVSTTLSTRVMRLSPKIRATAGRPAHLDRPYRIQPPRVSPSAVSTTPQKSPKSAPEATFSG
jgi:tartrate dehydrogenase/decarboxylase / D-malate dehydrogenase